MFILFVFVGLVLPGLSYALVCTELTAIPVFSQSFTSHSSHGTFDYPPYENACWEITAPVGYVLEMWTDDDFWLEFSYDCEDDYLKVSCGTDGEDGLIDKYCSLTGIDENSPVYTDGRSARIRFESDGNNNYDGFIFYYRAVLPGDSNGGDCEIEEDDSNEAFLQTSRGRTYAALSAVLTLIIIIVIIVVCVYACKKCCCSNDTKVVTMQGGGNTTVVAASSSTHHQSNHHYNEPQPHREPRYEGYHGNRDRHMEQKDDWNREPRGRHMEPRYDGHHDKSRYSDMPPPY